MTPVTLEPGPGFGVGRGFAIWDPFPVQAPDKAPETCTRSTRSEGGPNLLSRNLDGNQIAWKYRRCAGHANLLFRDGVKRQVGKCDCLLEFTTRPELSQSPRQSGHNSMCQNGLKILLRAIVGHGPKTGDLPSVWLDTCGFLPYQPDALARVAASPSQGFAGSKASRGQALFRSKELSFTHISSLTEVLTAINFAVIFHNTVHLFELSNEPNENTITV